MTPLVYSAHSLQAFVDCERRFDLHFLRKMSWPAIPADPPLAHERLMADGRRFHQMVQQDLLGVPVLAPTPADSDDLHDWWRRFQATRPADVPGTRFVERPLVGRIGPEGPPLVALYDLVVRDGDAATIFDWKTGKRPKGLAERLQTRVYRYLLAAYGERLMGSPVPPAAIRMVYWFVDDPDRPETFLYDEDAFMADELFLRGTIDRIAACREAGVFAMTPDRAACRFCVYRSYCDRGIEAGPLAESTIEEASTDGFDALGDFDAIEAISF